MRLYDVNDGKERYAICQYDEQFGDEGSELEFPFRADVGLMIVGSCNALLCIWEISCTRKCRITVWNPSIRKSVILAAPGIAGTLVVLGFDAHPTTHEYKLVRIVYQKYPYQHEFQLLVELYTQGTGSWRGLGSAFPHCCVIYSVASQAFVNGAVNWIAKNQRVSAGYPPSILSFDMSAETFSVMMLPPTLDDWKQAILSVTSFRESLAVFYNCPRHEDDCCIWVMKEYRIPDSWTKLFSFNLDRPVFLERTLGFRKRGEVVLLTMDNLLLSYDIGTKALVDTGFRGRPNAFYYDSFVEWNPLFQWKAKMASWMGS